MKKALLPLLLLALLSSTGCVKEVLLSSRLNGDWRIYSSKTSFVAAKDFSFTNIYTLPWTGTVNINGVPVTNKMNQYNNYSQNFWVSSDIFLSLLENKVYYKYKPFNATIDYTKFKSGELKVECSITIDNSPAVLNIDLKAPVVQMKKGIRYDFSMGQDPNGVEMYEIIFEHLNKIKGEFHESGSRNYFSGTWDLSIGHLFIAFKTKLFNKSYVEKYKYSFVNDKLYLTKDVEYSQNHFYGSIPKENIEEITHTSILKRK
ncbi:hypothetical protein MASR2M69_12030 [Bacteroidota bacterium]